MLLARIADHTRRYSIAEYRAVLYQQIQAKKKEQRRAAKAKRERRRAKKEAEADDGAKVRWLHWLLLRWY